ncbi:S8 family peptidase [Pseudobacteriovorax antillogorgiicola]|uniref:Subtilase family protein n=1 Tax=Pseudobacteriovorax antillogorgiicola TaxID=1513793 RepID=A0A1Y6CL23_9BACT|nr:S8/S53 family peptidase [Pseudobacteriovorax antillogorgiicola]TCS45643.1 subtilase family protein [Pseudobacteriovorax antillogorgiicola]SMF72806.1 Subtilase family protein [Pseudobacteriovorax antillogorgiicola]
MKLTSLLVGIGLFLSSCGSTDSAPELSYETNKQADIQQIKRDYQNFDLVASDQDTVFRSIDLYNAIENLQEIKSNPIIAVIDARFDINQRGIRERIWQAPPGIDTRCSGSTNGCNTSMYELNDSQYGNDNFELGSGFCSFSDSACYHGTAVAGLAVGYETGLEVLGVCPVCELLPLRVADDNGDIKDEAIIGALRYISNLKQQGVPVRVINSSFGKFIDSEKVALSIKELPGIRDTLIVAAAGNENTSRRSYPAGFENVISVASVDLFTNRKSVFSNYGSWVDIAAPSGVSNQWLDGISDSFRLDGTSFSAPLVSGVAGLVLSQEPELKAKDLRARLLATADAQALYGQGKNPAYLVSTDGQQVPMLGTGVVNANNAVTGTITATPQAEKQIKAMCGAIGIHSSSYLGLLLLVLGPFVITLRKGDSDAA